MIAENVKKCLEENLWFVSTCGDGPNVVPVGFKCVTEDGKLAIGALLLETTLDNIRANGKVAVAAANPRTAAATPDGTGRSPWPRRANRWPSSSGT